MSLKLVLAATLRHVGDQRSRQVRQRKLAAAAILKWENSEVSGGAGNGACKTPGAKLQTQWREQTEPSEDDDVFEEFGAGDGNRTHDTQLGKLMFYH